MPLEFTFTCPLPNSIHARPANALEEVAAQFESSIVIRNVRNENEADAKSILSLVSADIQHGDTCRVTIRGADEEKAFTTLKSFIENTFPDCDEPLPEIEVPEGEVVLPRMLRNEKASCLTGTPVSRGFGRGKAVIIGGLSLPAELRTTSAQNPEEEWESIEHALASLQSTLATRLREPAAATETAVLKAHLSIVRDPAFSKKLRETVSQAPHPSAAKALITTCEFFAATLKKAESLYIRERILDIQDICAQLMKFIYGSSADEKRTLLSEPSVVIAENLTPSRFLALDRTFLQGLVLSHGGITSHTVILARSFGIPTLTGIADAQMLVTTGQEVIVDADIGILLTQINPVVERYYTFEKSKADKRKYQLDQLTKGEAETHDGKRLAIAANISLPAEAEVAFSNHAEGIGLFRTEMLFMDSGNAPPSEEDQYQAYLQVVQAADNRPVIIRTLDIGGDKPLPYLSIPEENNPFLGYRGVRIYNDFPDLIHTQLRAIIRASAHGTVKVLVPMVTRLDEIKMVRNMIHDIQIECENSHIPFDPHLQTGIMVETPSTAFAIEQFIPLVDFFSIGTNDLAQYFFAVDRENNTVSHLYSYCNPPFIKFLKNVIDTAHAHGRWIGLCGEMAGDLQTLPLLAGLGLNEISCSAPTIPDLKSNLAHVDAQECKKLVTSAMACVSSEEVSRLLADPSLLSEESPLLDTELIITDAPSRTKEEVIKELCDSLYLAGRTSNPIGLEDDVWQREEVYSTDMGFGFAVPHCKTNHITASSIAVCKPATPIQWHPDTKPVHVVILLAIRECAAQNTHMKIFASLARKIMHEDFREYLISENDPNAIQNFLQENLTW